MRIQTRSAVTLLGLMVQLTVKDDALACASTALPMRFEMSAGLAVSTCTRERQSQPRAGGQTVSATHKAGPRRRGAPSYEKCTCGSRWRPSCWSSWSSSACTAASGALHRFRHSRTGTSPCRCCPLAFVATAHCHTTRPGSRARWRCTESGHSATCRSRRTSASGCPHSCQRTRLGPLGPRASWATWHCQTTVPLDSTPLRPRRKRRTRRPASRKPAVSLFYIPDVCPTRDPPTTRHAGPFPPLPACVPCPLHVRWHVLLMGPHVPSGWQPRNGLSTRAYVLWQLSTTIATDAATAGQSACPSERAGQKTWLHGTPLTEVDHRPVMRQSRVGATA